MYDCTVVRLDERLVSRTHLHFLDMEVVQAQGEVRGARQPPARTDGFPMADQ
jgi:hypothetical protein